MKTRLVVEVVGPVVERVDPVDAQALQFSRAIVLALFFSAYLTAIVSPRAAAAHSIAERARASRSSS